MTLESPLPASLPAGTSQAVYCSGTAWDGVRPVQSLALTVDGRELPVNDVRMPRFDVAERRSGFWAVIPVTAPLEAREIAIGVEVTGAGGSQHHFELGRIPITEPLPRADGPSVGGQELIAICLATFDPEPDLFRAQIESIRAQTGVRWTCVISDDFSSPQRYEQIRQIVGSDDRFEVSRSPARIGFYRNFERALTLAPPDAGLIALCDQDDVWYPDKLATLRQALGSAQLAYSDLRLVDEHGRVLRDTLWRGRANNRTSITSMLIANTVTGAASMFKREVAELAIPFPDSPGIEFHDHWIALIALAIGELAYVDRALYDYVQHGGAILGKVTEPSRNARARRRRLRAPRLRLWRAAYFLGYVPGEIRARTLLMRCGPALSTTKRRALNRYLSSGFSLTAFAWFVARPLRMAVGRTETLGGEWELALGIVWRRLATLVAGIPGWPDRYTLDTRFPDPPHFEQKRLRRWRERI